MTRLALLVLASLTALSSAVAGESLRDVVAREGRVVIGMGMDAAPFGYRDKDELVGFDVDIARAVVARLPHYLGKPITAEFKAVSDETRIAWVQSGEVHLSLCHTNATRKRMGRIDFSVPYGWDGKGVLYRRADGARQLADFSGRRVGIKRSSSSEGEIKKWFAAQSTAAPELVVFDNHAAGIQALVAGQIDGFTDDNTIIVSTAVRAGHAVGDAGVLAVTAPYSPAYFAIGVREDDSKWRKTIDFCLHDLWNSGEYMRIREKWFGPQSQCPIPLGDKRMEPYVDG